MKSIENKSVELFWGYLYPVFVNDIDDINVINEIDDVNNFVNKPPKPILSKIMKLSIKMRI